MNRTRATVLFLLLVVFPIVVFNIPSPGLVRIKMSAVSALKLPLKAISGIKIATKQIAQIPLLWRRNKELEERLKLSDIRNQRLQELEMENTRLRRMLKLNDKDAFGAIAARVIGRDPASWSKAVIIDKGMKDGVKLDSAVITADGLVGRISESGDTTSKVLLIVDINSRISCSIQRSREEGMLEGGGNNLCKLRYISNDADVETDDIVMTSGTGGIYPKGLIVGKIVKVGLEHSGLYKYAILKPAVSFSRLEEVLCIE